MKMMILSTLICIFSSVCYSQEWIAYNPNNIPYPATVYRTDIVYQNIVPQPIYYQYVPIISYTPVLVARYQFLFCKKESLVYIPTVIGYDLKPVR